MNVFETIKAAVTVRQAAERYGLRVAPNGMTHCPFHEDRHPSLKLNEDYFYCFGCGAHGDVIDFVARLFDLSSYEAAQKLAWDFGIDPGNPPASALAKPKYPKEVRCQRILQDYLNFLKNWKKRYSPSDPEGVVDDRFVEACQMLDQVEYLIEVLASTSPDTRAKVVERLCKGGMMDWLEQRLKEVDSNVEPEAA